MKQLDRNGQQGNKEFLTEVLVLSALHHENIINLIGYCADGEERLLVYEFMLYGSLNDHLGTDCVHIFASLYISFFYYNIVKKLKPNTALLPML